MKVIANVLHRTTSLVTGNQLQVFFKIMESHVWNRSKIQRGCCEDPEIQDLFVEAPQVLAPLRFQKALIFNHKVPRSLSSRKKMLRLFLTCLSSLISGVRAHLKLISTKVFRGHSDKVLLDCANCQNLYFWFEFWGPEALK